MAKFIAVRILEYKIERWNEKRNLALALGKNDEAWKLTMKIDNAHNRIMTWCYQNFYDQGSEETWIPFLFFARATVTIME